MNSFACASSAARSTSSSVASRRRRRCSRAPSPRRGTDPATRRRSRGGASSASRRARRRRRARRVPPSRRRSAARARRASSCPSPCDRSARSCFPARARGRSSWSTGPPGAYPNSALRYSTRPGARRQLAGVRRVGDLLGLVDDLEDPLAGRGRALRLADPHAEHAQRHHEHQHEDVEEEERRVRRACRAITMRPPTSNTARLREQRQEREQRHVERALAVRGDALLEDPLRRRSNFACSACSCANDFTTWTPTMFSSATVATSAIFCCTSRSSGCATC